MWIWRIFFLSGFSLLLVFSAVQADAEILAQSEDCNTWVCSPSPEQGTRNSWLPLNSCTEAAAKPILSLMSHPASALCRSGLYGCFLSSCIWLRLFPEDKVAKYSSSGVDGHSLTPGKQSLTSKTHWCSLFPMTDLLALWRKAEETGFTCIRKVKAKEFDSVHLGKRGTMWSPSPFKPKAQALS